MPKKKKHIVGGICPPTTPEIFKEQTIKKYNKKSLNLVSITLYNSWSNSGIIEVLYHNHFVPTISLWYKIEFLDMKLNGMNWLWYERSSILTVVYFVFHRCGQDNLIVGYCQWKHACPTERTYRHSI